MSATGRAALLLVLLLGAGVAACAGGGGGSANSADSTRELETQRDDVQAAARVLFPSLVDHLTGRVSNATGIYRGCVSSGLETYGSFRYTFGGRVDANELLAHRPYVDRLGAVVEEAGFSDVERGQRPGGETLSARKGSVELTISEFLTQGSYVLVDLEGPCVDTPDKDSDTWLGQDADDAVLD